MGSRLSILLYHRVLDEFDPLMPLEPNILRFDQQMKWVSRFYNVLDLAEAITKLKNNQLPPRALCITFDDGYNDNHRNALPVLEKYGLTATFFIATAYLNGGIMWNDSVIESIRKTTRSQLDLSNFGLSNIEITEDKVASLGHILNELKYLSFDQRKKIIAELPALLNVPEPVGLMMEAEDIKELHSRGMGIGGHTMNHPILSKITSEKANEEIMGGKQVLENIINARVSLFAYPNGKPGQDYKQEHVEMMKQAGFDAAVSTSWGVATEKSDAYQLPRFTPWDKNIAKFLIRLAKMRYSGLEMKV